MLLEQFGRRGFDYAGNGSDDLAVFAVARQAYAIRTSERVTRSLNSVVHLAQTKVSGQTWIKAFRVHQYAKNVLVFVPLLTAHAFTIPAALSAILAFLAFSACASGVYLINDLLDLQADRLHPTKRHRPLASGAIPVQRALIATPLLLTIAFVFSISVSLALTGVITGYLALTTAYSLYLKRKMLIDVVILAVLYTLRVLGGAVAISVVVSEWLLAFCVFIFLGLALIKRYIELQTRLDHGLDDPINRNYRLGDGSVVAALAAASGFNAVTVFTLYIASPLVQQMYNRPILLWLVCPIMIYWFARTLMMAHRRMMADDPIVFALKDKVSRLTVCAIVLIVVLAAI
jgi:4-hydroxybenzoate polyprenyltransferase